MRYEKLGITKSCHVFASRPSPANHYFNAGSTVPLHSPNPSRNPSSFSHTPLRLILSPSCKNLRVTSPPLSLISFSPAHMSSSKEPKLPSTGPEIVPLPNKSPGRMLHPFTV